MCLIQIQFITKHASANMDIIYFETETEIKWNEMKWNEMI